MNMEGVQAFSTVLSAHVAYFAAFGAGAKKAPLCPPGLDPADFKRVDGSELSPDGIARCPVRCGSSGCRKATNVRTSPGPNCQLPKLSGLSRGGMAHAQALCQSTLVQPIRGT